MMVQALARMGGDAKNTAVLGDRLETDILAGLKTRVGGELKAYTELLVEARQQATDRMVAQAEELGANAVLNIRYTTTSVTQGAAEILAYGTAVILD